MKKQMSTTQWLIGGTLLGAVLIFGLQGIASNTEERPYMNKHEESEESKSHVSFAQDTTYNEECGACHLAYPPNLLPVESWRVIMSGLEDHFGENAELETLSAMHITHYLKQEGLQKGDRSEMSKMLRNIPKKTPLRITELPYFINEHDEIPKRMISKNPEVGSLSQCDSCHKDAAKGNFDEDHIFIPGFGRWDD